MKPVTATSGPTPRTLEEAIKIAIYVGPLDQLEVRLQRIIRDYLAQKFSPAYLKASDAELPMLSELWTAITGELTIVPIEDRSGGLCL